ncbi:alpha/beta hydrolase [Ferruginibacter sp.]
MKKKILKLMWIVGVLYILICGALFFLQEKLIFFPEKLSSQYQFNFDQLFEEMSIKTKDGKLLSAVLFKAIDSKGLVFYLHGNAGAINSWGDVAKTYTALHYDVFILDYRGYGKSQGSISNQNQFFEDIQTAYDSVKNRYTENSIVILGYSIGSGPAAKLASSNNARLLILQAPYYSLTDMMRHSYPVIPTFILKYKFETGEYIKNCKMPVVVFHGDQDEVIYYGSSLKLQKQFKQQDTLITLKGQQHNGITENADYKAALEKILLK